MTNKKYDAEKLNQLYLAMIAYDYGDAKRIQHFAKVHSFAKLIAMAEKVEENTLFITEAAAYVHDIGIHPAEKKYGYQNGKLQEQEGPPEAERMMRALGFSEDVIERVCYLVGHHHTYNNIDGIDYQILVEADFLVNMFEDEESEEAVRKVRKKIFKTKTGLKILDEMFLKKDV
jgi:HD superfamily phosphodiesterase